MLSKEVHNLGFCFSYDVMRWKHLTAIAFSKIVGDAPPNEDWLDKWNSWRKDNQLTNLEISKGNEHSIPRAYGYNVDELPEVLKHRDNYE